MFSPSGETKLYLSATTCVRGAHHAFDGRPPTRLQRFPQGAAVVVLPNGCRRRPRLLETARSPPSTAPVPGSGRRGRRHDLGRNLGCSGSTCGRTRSAPATRTTSTSAHRPRPPSGRLRRGGRGRRRAAALLDEHGIDSRPKTTAAGASTSTCARPRCNSTRCGRPPCRGPLARTERPDILTAAWWKEERGRASSRYNQNAPHKTVSWPGPPGPAWAAGVDRPWDAREIDPPSSPSPRSADWGARATVGPPMAKHPIDRAVAACPSVTCRRASWTPAAGVPQAPTSRRGSRPSAPATLTAQSSPTTPWPGPPSASWPGDLSALRAAGLDVLRTWSCTGALHRLDDLRGSPVDGRSGGGVLRRRRRRAARARPPSSRHRRRLPDRHGQARRHSSALAVPGGDRPLPPAARTSAPRGLCRGGPPRASSRAAPAALPRSPGGVAPRSGQLHQIGATRYGPTRLTRSYHGRARHPRTLEAGGESYEIIG